MKASIETPEQQKLAVQRLTALWAFSESGLGGVLHALQVPFTGLVVGGFAILLITLIAHYSKPHFTTILKSLMLVLMVKAAVSPHTPFPAYIAVSFQAVIGYVLFSVFKLNLLSILLVSILSMVESALQKLLTLTLFFGKSFWSAVNELLHFIGNQFSVTINRGSYWLIGIYVGIYLIGGVLIGFVAYRLSKTISLKDEQHPLLLQEKSNSVKPKSKKRVYSFALIFFFISASLYLFAADEESKWISVAQAFSWTATALVLYYGILMPLLTNLLQKALQKKRGQYHQQLTSILAFLPVLQHLAAAAWKASSQRNGIGRLIAFLTTLITWTLTYSDNQGT